MMINKDRPSAVFIEGLNAETVSVSAGKPMIYDFGVSGISDGAAMKVPSSTSATGAVGHFAGVLLNSPNAGAVCRVQCYGFVNQVAFLTGTRAASTDSFQSMQSVAKAVALNIDTTYDAFVTTSAAVVGVKVYLAQSVASVQSAASTTAYTLLGSTTYAKAFIRNM